MCFHDCAAGCDAAAVSGLHVPTLISDESRLQAMNSFGIKSRQQLPCTRLRLFLHSLSNLPKLFCLNFVHYMCFHYCAVGCDAAAVPGLQVRTLNSDEGRLQAMNSFVIKSRQQLPCTRLLFVFSQFVANTNMFCLNFVHFVLLRPCCWV
jgi:hypothetical protein